VRVSIPRGVRPQPCPWWPVWTNQIAKSGMELVPNGLIPRSLKISPCYQRRPRWCRGSAYGYTDDVDGIHNLHVSHILLSKLTEQDNSTEPPAI
jgi:hypothetical protein